MADITHGTWIKDGKAVDAVYQSGVKVYSRNMLADSGFESGNTPANYTWSGGQEEGRSLAIQGGAETYPSPMGKFMLRVGNFSSAPTTALDQYAFYPITPVIIKKGETWTYSYYYAISGSASRQASDFIMVDGVTPIWKLSMSHDLRETSGDQTTWHHFVKTWTADIDVTASVLRFGFIKTSATPGWVCIDNVKLEKNYVVSPWSPAPEDILK